MDFSESRKCVANWLIGKKMLKMGRAADMPWILFGEHGHKPSATALERCTEYSMHIQCPVRMVEAGEVIWGNYDIYCAGIEVDDALYPYPIGMSMFDQKVEGINLILPLLVTDVRIHENGDVKISLQKDISIEVFVAGSMSSEYWRVFLKDPHGSEHIVYTEYIPRDGK